MTTQPHPGGPIEWWILAGLLFGTIGAPLALLFSGTALLFVWLFPILAYHIVVSTAYRFRRTSCDRVRRGALRITAFYYFVLMIVAALIMLGWILIDHDF